MPKYEAYATSKDTSSRNIRKGSRRKTFLANRAAGRLAKNARHDKRVEIAEARAARAEAALEAAQGTEQVTEA